jgi:anoctamin-10
MTKLYSEDHTDWDWICNDNAPKDFATLLRFTIIAKLSRDAHIHVRSFLSTDGKFIYLVLKAKEDKRKLSNIKMNYISC